MVVVRRCEDRLTVEAFGKFHSFVIRDKNFSYMKLYSLFSNVFPHSQAEYLAIKLCD